VQNDEATVSFDLMVDQVTEGHEFLLRHFGMCSCSPRSFSFFLSSFFLSELFILCLLFIHIHCHSFPFKTGVKPKIAWQVDPFGHSSLTPTVFSQFGYEALGKRRRKKERNESSLILLHF
jgi:hypothetical protein